MATAKRIFQLVVLFFAIYAFVFVPLGKMTALEHLRAIIGTPAAQHAAAEVKDGAVRLVQRLRSEAQRATEERTEPGDSSEPEPAKKGPVRLQSRQPRTGPPSALTPPDLRELSPGLSAAD